jgi:hypothetical protein
VAQTTTAAIVEEPFHPTANSDFDYFVKSVLNDTDVIFYDLYNNEGTSASIGDIVFTIEIVDPTYYGKERTGILEQIENMGNQLNVENQMNGLYSNPELTDENGVVKKYENVILFYSTEYKSIEGTDWAFLISNSTCNGVHNNALMGMAQFKDRWLVMNLTSVFSDDSSNLELDKAVYEDFYEVYDLQDCLTLDQLMSLN